MLAGPWMMSGRRLLLHSLHSLHSRLSSIFPLPDMQEAHVLSTLHTRTDYVRISLPSPLPLAPPPPPAPSSDPLNGSMFLISSSDSTVTCSGAFSLMCFHLPGIFFLFLFFPSKLQTFCRRDLRNIRLHLFYMSCVEVALRLTHCLSLVVKHREKRKKY